MLSAKTYLKLNNTNQICLCIPSDASQSQEGDVLINRHLNVQNMPNNSNIQKIGREGARHPRQKQSLKTSKIIYSRQNTPRNDRFKVDKEERPNLRRRDNQNIQNTSHIFFSYLNLQTEVQQQSRKSQFPQKCYQRLRQNQSKTKDLINNIEKLKENNHQNTSIDITPMKSLRFNTINQCSRSIIGDQLQIDDFYSHQNITNGSDQTGEIATSIQLKKKTTRKEYRIEQFNFIKTHSINDSESQDISTVLNTSVSNESQNYSENDYHFKKKTFHHLFHRYSKVSHVQRD